MTLEYETLQVGEQADYCVIWLHGLGLELLVRPDGRAGLARRQIYISPCPHAGGYH